MPVRTVIQWDKEDCADLGLIKVDLLGLGMMAALKETIGLIPRHYNTRVDLAALPEDPLVYETLRKADTVGMFQVESRAQMASLPLNAPTRFYDLVVQVAIIRPGPIAGKMMHPYMRRRQGKEEVTYPHPALEPVLKRTLGIPIFQEQLLRMAMAIANFTGAEADELRRAVGMRRSMERMNNLEGRLRAGMTRNGISPVAQDNIVHSISSFAMYGFPESHAASFALIAYASAYLKEHYLAAFTCALLNNQPMGFYSPAVLIKDAQRHGLRVRPIDIQRSQAACSLEEEADHSLSLRIGLNYARGMRSTSIEALLADRNLYGSFASVDEVARRVPTLNRKELVLLARIGVLNTLGDVAHRRDALWQVEEAGRPVGPLLRGAAPTTSQSTPLVAMTTDERLTADYAGAGLTTGPHPMAYHRAILSASNILSAADLIKCRTNASIQIAGCVIARQRPGTAKGFVFLSLEDEAGIANIILTPDVFERNRLIVTRNRFLLIAGQVQNTDGVIHVKAQSLEPLDISNAPVSSHDFH
jgi:error-prone DNA polymerase